MLLATAEELHKVKRHHLGRDKSFQAAVQPLHTTTPDNVVKHSATGTERKRRSPSAFFAQLQVRTPLCCLVTNLSNGVL